MSIRKFLSEWSNPSYQTTAEAILAADISTTSQYPSFEVATGMTASVVCGISGKIKVTVSSQYKINTGGATFFRYMRVYRGSAGTDIKSLGSPMGNANEIVFQGGTVEYTGLTPGTSYTFGIEWATENSSAGLICNASSVPQNHFMRLYLETE